MSSAGSLRDLRDHSGLPEPPEQDPWDHSSEDGFNASGNSTGT